MNKETKGTFFSSLPFRLILGIIIGAVIGLILQYNLGSIVETAIQNGGGDIQNAVNEAVALNGGIWGQVWQVITCLHRLMGQFVSFCVPLIVLGFICPSIVKMGDNAGKLLGIALVLAYVSSVLAALMSVISGYALVPFLGIIDRANSELTLPSAIFQLDIPKVMEVITALFLSIAVGLAVIWKKANTWKLLLIEFQDIVLEIVTKMVIPILPFYIGTTFTTLGFNGTLAQFPVFIKAIIIVLIGHFIWMTILYIVAGVYSGKNPVEVFKHYGPAYITAVGTMSSAATLSVALQCANKSKVLRKDLVGFAIPLFANIHLCGSVLTETFFVMIISRITTGALPSIGTMILFILLLGIFAVGAPGVPGGTVVASLGIVTSVLGFNDAGTGLLLAIFALQDSFGTACNVTADGALTLFLTGYCKKHDIKEVK